MGTPKKRIPGVFESGGIRKARFDEAGGQPEEVIDGRYLDLTGVVDLNDKVKASSSDPTSDYLDGKVDNAR